MLFSKSLFWLYTFLAVLIFIPEYTSGQNDIIVMKAAFMERFTRFIEWPSEQLEEEPETPFKILILGDNPFGKSLETLFSTTKIKKKNVQVLYSNKVSDLENCHMVYVSSSMQDKLNQILSIARNYSILTIGDTFGFAEKGIMINFFIDDDILRFEINVDEFEKSNLKVSHLLINIAKDNGDN